MSTAVDGTFTSLILLRDSGTARGGRTGQGLALLPAFPARRQPSVLPISAPTMVIWGQRDGYLGPELAEPEHDDVPNLVGVERLPDASHWVHHDEANRVNDLLIDFLR